MFITMLLSFAVILSFAIGVNIEDLEEHNRSFDVGEYFQYAEIMNGQLKLSSRLESAFLYSNVSGDKAFYCIEAIEECNLDDKDCSIEELSPCLIKESVLNFNAVKNGQAPYACPSCPRSMKVRNEFRRGDFDESVVEQIKKVESENYNIGVCYKLLKDHCLDNLCRSDILVNKCLTAEDTEDYLRKYASGFLTEENLEEEIERAYYLEEEFTR